MAETAFPLLFSPVRLGQAEAPNRIVSTSHGTNMAVGGAPGERLIAYHAEKARGGCGTGMMFGSAADSPLTAITPNHVQPLDAAALPGVGAAAGGGKGPGALAV